MAAALIPLLIPSNPLGGEFLSGVPAKSKNIFQRIIRDPRPESAHARERECTEMLAAVLINAPSLRQHLFRWLAQLSGLDPKRIEELEFEFDTEASIGAKRDDLRIRGRRRLDDDQAVLIWSIEVKVGSSLHQSSMQHLGDNGEPVEDEEPDEELDKKLVNQLKHYDDWLCVQRTEICGGFVLALRDLSEKIKPLNLKGPWKCFSWTKLGLEVKAAIDGKTLPSNELLLASHLLGFIRTNLWRNDEMPETTLDFNDIALIRAFSQIGMDCENKVNGLVEGLLPIVKKSGVGNGVPKAYQRLYKSNSCAGIDRFIVPQRVKNNDPSLDVSIGYTDGFGDYMGVWILMSPMHEKWPSVREAVVLPLKKLRKRNPN